MVAWVADQHFMMCLPSRRHPPEVDLRDRTQPPQSVSVYTSHLCASWNGYVNTSRGLALSYRARRLSAAMAKSVGRDIRRHTSFAANMMSGRSAER